VAARAITFQPLTPWHECLSALISPRRANRPVQVEFGCAYFTNEGHMKWFIPLFALILLIILLRLRAVPDIDWRASASATG
jgi:hypothetical protein